MISLLAALAGLALVIMMLRKNRPAFVAAFFIVFSLSYRIIDVLYVDLFGPLYAIELDRYVGGNIATPMFVAACCTFILPAWYFYRPSAMQRKLGDRIPNIPYFTAVRRLAFLGCTAFLAALYLDMLRRGTIPLLVGMDRLEYNLQAGILHNPLYSLSFLLSTTLGIFTVLPRLQGGRYDLRFAMLFLSLLFYWILTGNRFSIFYRDLSFFMLPFGAVLAMEATGKLSKLPARDAWAALFSSRVIIPVAALLSVATLTGLLVNSFYDVRGYADPLYQMNQRAFVQPVELWDTTWSALDFDDVTIYRPEVAQALFVDPIDPSANTSMQYLMVRELGYFRATELLFHGTQYAGGYPEIFFELFGPWIALPVLLPLGIATAFLLRLNVIALSHGRLLTALLSVYVYFAFTLPYIGGMLNFIIAVSFFLKAVLLAAVAVLEKAMLKRLTQRQTPPAAALQGAAI